MATKISEQLAEFIARAKTQSKSDSEIRVMLVASGWDENVVNSALTPVGDLVPPPPPAPKSSGREIFFYLLQFFTLGTSAVSLGGVIFAIIDRYLTNEVAQQYYYQAARPVTGFLASLIVALPVYAVVSWKLIRDAAAGRASVRSGIRRIITYLALFLASATVIGDVIALVYRFLAGEVDSRFLFKVLTILLIGGWIIWYYYMTVKKDERAESYPTRWHQSHGLVLAVIFLVVVVSGFMLSGSPQERQKLVRDGQRITDLQSIYYQAQQYYDREGKLAANLTELVAGYVPQEPLDPQSKEPYRYVVGDGLNYQLCANFETDDKQLNQSKSPMYAIPIGEVNWSHPASDYCFELKVTPRLDIKP